MTNREPHPRTKIVATLGPASSNPETVQKLLKAGVSVFRVNASHGDHASHKASIERIRAAADELDRPVGVLLDLQGPKIRLGRFQGVKKIQSGTVFSIAVDREPQGDELSTGYAALTEDVQVGHRLLIDDGQLSSVVTSVAPGTVQCRALNDAELEQKKGINLPDSRVSAPSLSAKDKEDTLFAMENGADAIALSFVRKAADVRDLREFMEANGQPIPIISKIEKPQALDNLDSILRESWGVMVARGDLGVELSPEEVPMAQKKIIHSARRLRRPVITATQMLGSMTHNPRPTRAEASDVANAVLDGTDAVMLSQETAVGEYAVESVEMMARINAITKPFRKSDLVVRRRERRIDTKPEAVADAGVNVAHHLGAHALVTFTKSGMTAVLASSRRPEVPIISFSSRPEVRNLLCMVWGVSSYRIDDVDDTDSLIRTLDQTLVREGLAKKGDRLVVLMGAPSGRMGPTNLMLVYEVGNYGP